MSNFEIYCCYALVGAVAIFIGCWLDRWSERRRRRRMMALTREETMELRRWILGSRWKGELYVLPTIRIGWLGAFGSDPRLFWIGIYWLQWSIHVGLVEVRPRIW